MKKKLTQMICVNVFIALLFFAAWHYTLEVPVSDIEMKVIYGEFHANLDGGTSQLFWAEGEGGFSEEHSMMCNMNELDSSVIFRLPEVDLEHARFRFDPFMNAEPFSIDSIEFSVYGKRFFTLSGDEFYEEIAGYENVEWSDKEKVFTPLTEDPVLYLGEEFSEEILESWLDDVGGFERISMYIFFAVLTVWLEIGMLIYVRKNVSGQIRMTKGHLMGLIVADVCLCLGAGLVYGANFLRRFFGNISMADLLYYANTTLEGTNVSAFYQVIFDVLAIFAGVTLFVAAGDWLLRKVQKQKGYPAWTIGLAACCLVYAFCLANDQLGIISYCKFIMDESAFYEERYVSAEDVEITFPEEKRNLIYIFLESMEVTYADKASGGAMQDNYIPELTMLALENIDFSDEGVLGGAYTTYGASFTMGGLVAQTAGIPINTSYISGEATNAGIYEGYLLPGAQTIGDVLAKEGYQQVFMIGSEKEFGARGAYFKGHGDYKVSDYNTAIDEGKIAEDYKVWWGYEDIKLIEYAKEELLLLAGNDEPFNFTMLTVDTHFTDGYFCSECTEEYGEQYSDVIACSSRQISEFVEWIKEQDFYENTTVVIVGDHLTMDSDYIERHHADTFNRRVYATIINPAEGRAESEYARQYTTLDMYPTTLAALGAEIEGNRLGLGVNLFSDELTLYEEYGAEYVNNELLKKSKFYANELLYKKAEN